MSKEGEREQEGGDAETVLTSDVHVPTGTDQTLDLLKPTKFPKSRRSSRLDLSQELIWVTIDQHARSLIGKFPTHIPTYHWEDPPNQ